LVTASGTAASENPVLHYSLLAHFPHFLLGAAAVPLYFRIGGAARTGATWIAPTAEALVLLASLAVLVILSTAVDDRLQIPGGRYTFPVVPVLLVAILCFVPFSVVAKALLESFPWRMLGTISYGVYIYHLPVQNATARYMKKLLAVDAGSHWLLFGVSSLALTVLVATLSFVLVEKPVLSLARKRTASSG
jgi:peptidoglycan/LPS O-acetylase OafA/YrhL